MKKIVTIGNLINELSRVPWDYKIEVNDVRNLRISKTDGEYYGFLSMNPFYLDVYDKIECSDNDL
jgi:hypothetical protein